MNVIDLFKIASPKDSDMTKHAVNEWKPRNHTMLVFKSLLLITRTRSLYFGPKPHD
jgi:hypothetical protein